MEYTSSTIYLQDGIFSYGDIVIQIRIMDAIYKILSTIGITSFTPVSESISVWSKYE